MSTSTRREYLEGLGLVGIGSRIGSEPATGAADSPSGAWPGFQFDGGNSGYTPGTYGPVRDLHERRTFDPPAGTVTGPALTDSTLFLGTSRERDAEQGVYAYDRRDGTERWQQSVGAVGSVAVVDGTVIATTGTTAYGLDAASGDRQWQVDARGVVNVGSVAAFDAPVAVVGRTAIDVTSGDRLWTAAGPEATWTSPAAVSAELICYRSGAEPAIVAVNPADGSVEWQQSGQSGTPRAAPTLVDGRVYTVVRGDHVEAYDARDGAHRWTSPQLPDTPVVNRTPAVADGVVYQAADRLLAFDADDGSQLWSVDPEGQLVGTVAVTAESVYASSLDGTLLAATRDGEVREEISVSASTGRVAVDAGSVYVGYTGRAISEVRGQVDTPTPTPTTVATTTDSPPTRPTTAPPTSTPPRPTRTTADTGGPPTTAVGPGGGSGGAGSWLLWLLVPLLFVLLVLVWAARRRSADEEEPEDGED